MAKLTFLGTSGSVLTKERMCAGILFEDKLLDVGFGVLTNLVRSRKKLDSINDLYISHTHSDYIGDTAKSEKISEFAKGCDVLIHDSTYLDGQESLAALTQHSTARDAANTAKLAKARRLVLTHFSPGNEGAERRYLTQASAVFDGRIVVAKDHQILEV